MKFDKLVRLILEKNYDEAWELFHLKDENVKKIVKDLFKLDYPTPEAMDKDSKVDDLAHKLGSYMDTLPVVKYPWNEIPNLKETDPKWIKAMQSIQNSPDVESEYIKLMTQRDNQGEPRPGGKKGNDELFNGVKQGTEDPVVILKLPTGMYAVGGRTRMYAALASKTNIKAIILTPEILSKFVNS